MSKFPGKQEKSSNSLSSSKWITTYLPAAGGVSALLFSTNVMNPKLFRSFFSPHQLIVANGLWFNAHVGTGLYLYSRRHIGSASMPYRLGYSVYGAVLFNFGTVLFWATTKTLLPQNDFLRTVFGLGSGIALFALGRHYLNFVDDQTTKA